MLAAIFAPYHPREGMRPEASMKRALPLILAAFVLDAHAAAAQQPMIGTRAPEIALPDVAGKRVSLSAMKGDIVVLHFAASW